MKRAMTCLIGILILAGMSLAPAPALARSPQPFAYVSPAAGAQHISPTTSLAFHHGAAIAPNSVTASLFVVTGSQSGRHTGAVRLSDDMETILFYPDQAFAYAETVSVEVRPGVVTASGQRLGGDSYTFQTLSRPMPTSSSRAREKILSPAR